jgi:hypothetical protein
VVIQVSDVVRSLVIRLVRPVLNLVGLLQRGEFDG